MCYKWQGSACNANWNMFTAPGYMYIQFCALAMIRRGQSTDGRHLPAKKLHREKACLGFYASEPNSHWEMAKLPAR